MHIVLLVGGCVLLFSMDFIWVVHDRKCAARPAPFLNNLLQLGQGVDYNCFLILFLGEIHCSLAGALLFVIVLRQDV